MVATSNCGEASAAIGGNCGGGSGIVHMVAGVARAKFNGMGFGPWDQLPAIELPSALSFPSYAADRNNGKIECCALQGDGSYGQRLSALVDAVIDSLKVTAVVFCNFHDKPQSAAASYLKCSLPGSSNILAE